MEQNKIPSIPLTLLKDSESDTIFGQLLIDNREKFSLFDSQVPPQRLDGAALCLCLQGTAELHIDTQLFSIEKNTLCVVFPGSILQFLGKSDNFRGYALYTTGNLLDSLQISSPTEHFLFIKSNPCIVLSDQQGELLLQLLRDVTEKNTIPHTYRPQIVSNLLSNICFEIAEMYLQFRNSTTVDYSRQSVIFRDFIRLVGEHCRTERRLEFYAGKLHITSHHLSEVVKSVSGNSATKWITNQVILNAKVLLTENDLTALQVSEMLNFPNASFFGQFFKKHTGTTPKEYRRHVFRRQDGKEAKL